MIVINSSTRQFNIPGADLVFGVEADSGSAVKEFQCPRYVGNNLDLTGCFIRINYRNANGEVDSYLIPEVTVDGDNIVFGWELSPKVTMYKGNVSFVMCVVGPDTKVKWHTTLGRGQVLEGLEPNTAMVESGTADVVAALITMVEAQTGAVEAVGENWIAYVKAEGDAQVQNVKAVAEAAQADTVAEIEAKGVNVRESIPDDYTALSEAVDGLVRGSAGAIVCEVEGSVITMNDASDNYMQGLRIFGRSTQDGTPTPEAPVEIVSVENPVVTVCGKNLLPVSYKNGVSRTHGGLTYTVNDDGSIHVVGTVTSVESYFVLSDFDFGKSSVGKGQSNGIYAWSDCLYNAPSNYTMLYFSQGKEVDQVCYPQVELGTVVTEWESPSGQTISTTHTLPGIPVTSGGNYTDNDGQEWICDEVDLERGVYVQRVYPRVFDGVDGETIVLYAERENVYGFTLKFTDASMQKLAHGAYCTHFENIITGISSADKECFLCGAGSASIYVLIRKDRLTEYSVDAFKTWLAENPITILFQLATPIETALSETEIAAYRALHSNYPNTTVLNDSGAHMVAKYAADTKLYIDNKIAALVGG